MKKNLAYYIQQLARLRQGGAKGGGGTPHKPIFLLSLCEVIAKGWVMNNRFLLDSNLVAIFRENFKLLIGEQYTPDITRPFYHLQNDQPQFWFVLLQNGDFLQHYVASIQTLSTLVDYAYLEAELFDLISQPSTREQFTQAILDRYFPTQKSYFLAYKQDGGGYAHQLLEGFTGYILNHQPTTAPLDNSSAEEEFVRSSLFKRIVPQLYDYTCAISGFKLLSHDGNSLLDACHIIPFSKTKDDRVINGLALCPNLHRAFDRGWLAIDQDWSILVSSRIMEWDGHPYALQHFRGQKLRLPFGGQHVYPSLANLAWHRQHIFKP